MLRSRDARGRFTTTPWPLSRPPCPGWRYAQRAAGPLFPGLRASYRGVLWLGRRERWGCGHQHPTARTARDCALQVMGQMLQAARRGDPGTLFGGVGDWQGEGRDGDANGVA